MRQNTRKSIWMGMCTLLALSLLITGCVAPAQGPQVAQPTVSAPAQAPASGTTGPGGAQTGAQAATQAPASQTSAPSQAPAASQGGNQPSVPSGGGKTLRIGMPENPKVLNPYLSDYIYVQEAVVYNNCKLVQFAPDLTVAPYLASSWDVSPDGKTYTFHLDKNAKWHDGQPVTAKDVAYTFKMTANPDSGSIYYDKVRNIVGAADYHDKKATDISGIKAVDDKTLQVTLENPSASFLAIQASYQLVVPEHLLGSVDMKDVANAPYWRNPVGCGPFKWDKYIPDQYIHLTKNADFFIGAPKVDDLYLVIGKIDALEASFAAGNLDFTLVESTAIKTFQGLNFARLLRGDSYVDNLVLNQQKPFLKDANFRKALMYAIDRQSIVNSAWLGNATVAVNCFVTPWTLSPNITKYDLNPDKAKELLKQAGWDGSQTLDFLLATGSPETERTDLIIQQNLAAVGIKSRIESMDFNTMLDRMVKGTFDMAVVGYGTMSLLPDAAVNYVGANATPPNGSNYSYYKDPELTGWFDQALNATDQKTRQQIFNKITERTSDQLPLLPLDVEQMVVAVNNRVVIPDQVLIPRNRPGQFTWVTWNINTWDVK